MVLGIQNNFWYLLPSWIRNLLVYIHGYVKKDIGMTMIYLTHWGHKLITFSFVYNSILVVVRYIQENREKRTENNFFEKNCALMKISWGSSLTANNLAIAVTLVYWSALFGHTLKLTPLEVYEDYDTHLIQTVITLLDTVLSERPWRLSHAIYPSLFAILITLNLIGCRCLCIIFHFDIITEFSYPILNNFDSNKRNNTQKYLRRKDKENK